MVLWVPSISKAITGGELLCRAFMSALYSPYIPPEFRAALCGGEGGRGVIFPAGGGGGLTKDSSMLVYIAGFSYFLEAV